MKKILHITSLIEWEKAKKNDVYTTPSLEKEKFIHCSLLHQITRVANANFKGQQGLVLLEIAEKKLLHEVKYEDLYNLDEDFPHLYGPLNINSVLRVIPFPSKEDGTFELPTELQA